MDLKQHKSKIKTNKEKQRAEFLVVAALQEELNEFFKLNIGLNKKKPLHDGVCLSILKWKGKDIKILTYSPNKMGMPFNAASVMRIINMFDPICTILIGTCASLNDTFKHGDILIPHRVFSHESGKLENGKFYPDNIAYETGDMLRREAETLQSKICKKHNLTVYTDIDFCSGATVINDAKVRDNLIRTAGSRKVYGLDMEAYSIACINSILITEGKELLVIKSVSDFAVGKSTSEKKGQKERAKKNAAFFALELIKHIDELYFRRKTTTASKSEIQANPDFITDYMLKLGDANFIQHRKRK